LALAVLLAAGLATRLAVCSALLAWHPHSRLALDRRLGSEEP
jgi:hypothetical protein